MQRQRAETRADEARSKELAAKAVSERETNPELGLLLAAQANEEARTPEAELALRDLSGEARGQLALAGHSGGINAAAISRDGRYAATASDDATARVWNTRTGEPVQTLMAEAGPVTDVAIDPSGERAVTGTIRGTVILWSTETGERITELPTPGLRSIQTVAFSPSGEMVAAGGGGGARIWTVRGRPSTHFRDHRRTVFSIEFARDGRAVASSDIDGTARVWDSRTGRSLAVLQVPSRAKSPYNLVSAAILDPSGRLVLTAGDDGIARL